MSASLALVETYVATHPQEAARMVERLPADELAVLLAAVSAEAGGALIASVTSAAAARAIERLPVDDAARRLEHLGLDLLAALLRRLDPIRREQILNELPADRARAARALLAQVPETAGRIAGLVSGEFDIITNVAPDQINELSQYDGVDVRTVALANSHMLAYSEQDPVLADKRVRKALDLAINRASSDETLKQATFGKGQALRLQKKRDEAKKLFEEIVAAKNWRGLEKAGALYELGEIESEGGDKGAAHAYFQRVYLSHGAYPQFAIKSYLRAADMLRSVGKQDEAKATMRELIRKYPDSEEAKKARTIVD